jgi:cell division protein YceG involved in septum cleavage
VAPAETAYLYFVARGGGYHAFAETPERHQANVEKYRDR